MMCALLCCALRDEVRPALKMKTSNRKEREVFCCEETRETLSEKKREEEERKQREERRILLFFLQSFVLFVFGAK